MFKAWDMVGLRVGDAFVHKRATFKIVIASSDEYSDPKSGSTSSSRHPLSCKTYAWEIKNYETYIFTCDEVVHTS